MSGDETANHDPAARDHSDNAPDPERAHVTPPAGTSPEIAAAGDRAAGEGAPAAPVCDLCGARMLEHHCKLVCPNCGYMRDCSDP